MASRHARFWRTRTKVVPGWPALAGKLLGGLRPARPGNVPYIGASAVKNLWLNTGHGTLEWTHGCGSSKAIAELMSGRITEVCISGTYAVT